MAADGHLGMTALPRVTLASAGLSCFTGYNVPGFLCRVFVFAYLHNIVFLYVCIYVSISNISNINIPVQYIILQRKGAMIASDSTQLNSTS